MNAESEALYTVPIAFARRQATDKVNSLVIGILPMPPGQPCTWRVSMALSILETVQVFHAILVRLHIVKALVLKTLIFWHSQRHVKFCSAWTQKSFLEASAAHRLWLPR
jgi:hypothetical protein